MVNVQLSTEETIPVEEMNFEGLDRRYKWVQMVGTTLMYLLLAALSLFFLLLDTPWWCVVAEGMLVLAYLFNMFILQKAYLFKGYALREYDISYRSGVLWPKITTVPYMRVQQVCVEQNPVSKLFGLYSVEVVNGAQTLNSLNVHGLTEERAAYIKNVITEKLRLNHD